MYQKNYRGHSNGNKNSYSSYSKFGQGGYGYGGGRSSGGGRSFGGRRHGRPATKGIPDHKFIKKAEIQEEAPPIVPNHAFADFALNPLLHKNIEKRGYTHPTDIQDKTIPHILEGKDVIGIANTGSGKTAAFLIPLLNKIANNRHEKILIVAPTRELAMQIRQEMRIFAEGMNVYATLCIGGASIRDQIYEIRRKPNLIIGTPGRIQDLVDRNALYLGDFHTVVLDEVDRMLDMGFRDAIKKIIALLPAERHALFFSATLSPEINSIIESFVKDAITVSVKTQETSANVDQDVVRVEGKRKTDVLEELLQNEDFKKVLIFGRTKNGVENLSKYLYQRGYKVNYIHGDKPQSKRTQAIRMFKEDVIRILVATDVASRGIDISDISHVINYDKPETYDDYVHRIGRTGRANKKAVALTFVD